MKELTDIQTKTLETVKQFISDNGYSPTIRELADIFGIKEKACYDRLFYIRKKGRLDWQDGKARTLRIIKD